MGIGEILGYATGFAADKAIDAADKKREMNRALKGRTPEQQAVIKYFNASGGCMNKCMSDDEYESMVMAKAKSIDFKKKALDKIGIDESQVNEINPIHLEDYMFDDKVYALCGKDGLWRSSAYQISWIFFSSTQIYVYQFTFNMDNGEKKERTEEYFYKDVRTLSIASDTIEKEVVGKVTCRGDATYIRTNIETNHLNIGGFYCSMKKNDYTDKAIQGMRAKVREKNG